MTLRRAVPLLLALAGVSPATAQFADTPGTPGAQAAPPFGTPPTEPPAACQQLLSLRDETHKHAQALQSAGQKKAGPEELCKLFKAYLAAEGSMVKGLEEHQATCGLPPSVTAQVKAHHVKASQIGTNICEMASQGPRSPWFDAPVPQCTEKTLMLGVPCVD